MTEADWMMRAIAEARRGIAAGQSPFGAVVARGGEVVAVAHNTVGRDTDPTAHAEVNVLRIAAAILATTDLRGCTLVSTCEPCPMCLAAIHGAKVDRVVFGASIADAAGAGFAQLPVGARELAAMGGSPLIVEGGLLRAECAGLFRDWQDAGPGRPK